MSELMERQTIATLAAQHDEILKLTLEGLEKLCDAKKRMRDQCGPYADLLSKAGHYRSESWLACEKPDALQKEAAQTIQESFWRYTLAQTGIREAMSPTDRKRMDAMFENHETPPFDVANIVATLGGLAENADEIYKQAVREVWEDFRPGKYQSNRHKTNGDPSGVQEKIILANGVENYGYGFSLGYSRGQRLNELDKVFHVLDGKGLPKQDKYLSYQIAGAMKQKETTHETEYFRFKWYMAGTLHIRIKRLDLLRELNRIGADGLNELKRAS